MLAYFERLIDPLPDVAPERPPATLGAYFAHFLWPIRGVLVLAVLLSMIAAGVELALYWFLGRIVDWLTRTDPALVFETYGPALLAMAAFVLVLRPFTVYLSRAIVNVTLFPGLTAAARWRAHRYVVRQSLGFFQNDFAGRVAQKVMQNGPAIRGVVGEVIDGVLYFALYILGTFVMFAGLDLWLFAPVALWLAAYGVIVWKMVPSVRDLSAAMSEQNSVLSGRVVDGYTNILSVKLFAHATREEDFVREAMERQVTASRALMRAIMAMTVTLTAVNGAMMVATGGIALMLWRDGQIAIGGIALAVALVIRLNQMSGWILRTITALFENIGTAENAMETVARPVAFADRPGAAPFEVGQGAVRFERVTFGYGGKRPVIRDLSLDIAPGERVGLVGPSGAGKTTRVNLLLRFYDVEAGRILIDGTDIAGVTQESLRERIGVVTQDTSLLHRSVRENIRYARPEADDEAVLAAARAARVDAFLDGLVDRKGRRGLDAEVGERGVKLSGGQRQRIAIARVILKDAPILVLDEATSALDSEAEAAIQENLARLMEGKTVIAIAHRLSTIAHLDRLIVLDEGRIVAQGTHDALIRRGGLYADLWARQSGGFLGKAAA